MRKAYVGVTDGDWYRFLSSRPDLTEVNFWKPGGATPFKALSQGDLFLFKLHSPDNFIVGGGFYAAFSFLPVSLAWDTFADRNGVQSLEEMRARVEKYRRVPSQRSEDYVIGNVVLEQAFFFERDAWIPSPPDFKLNTVQGKTYDLDKGTGRDLWVALQERLLHKAAVTLIRPQTRDIVGAMFSDPVLVKRRLGQGAFRVLVTDVYGRQCAVTREHTLPVLEAAHIQPISKGGEHRVSNGLLLRSDIHTLFDAGYVTVTPQYEFRVSQRLDADWQNGKVYYAVAGEKIVLPRDESCWPDKQMLEWHADSIFRG